MFFEVFSMKYLYPVKQQTKFFYLQAEIDSLLYKLKFAKQEDSNLVAALLSPPNQDSFPVCSLEQRKIDIVKNSQYVFS
jgi:hypothetical protein